MYSRIPDWLRWAGGFTFVRPLGACRRIPSSARERAIFSPGKDGEADDVGFIVDAAGCSQADNSGCLDPTVAATAPDTTIQEKEPLEARSNSPTGS